MEQVLHNLRYAFRTLRRSPGFTAVATLTLALGIGVNTAIFSIVNAVLFAPLPFHHPEQLVQVFSTQSAHRVGPSRVDAMDFAAQNRTFQELRTFDSWRKNISGIGGSSQPEELYVGLASPEYFQLLGVVPLMGRIFTDEENHYGKHYEVLISETFWRTRFGADRSVLGQTFKINSEPYTIIGVLPAVIPDWMNANRKVLLWTPEQHQPGGGVATEADRQSRGWLVFGRLKPGVTREQAQADLERVAAVLAQQHPLDKGFSVAIRPLAESRVGSLGGSLWLLVLAVGFILLIACSNIANLLLARNTARNREFALRSALGASRARLIHQLVTESLVLALLGALVGLGLGWFGSMAVARLHPASLPQLAGTAMDWRVLLFTVTVAIFTGFLFGLMPAFTGTRSNLVEALKEGGQTSSASGRREYFRRLIVVMEIGFSLMLVIGAALLIQTIARLQGQQTGFSQDHLLRPHLALFNARYPDAAKITEFCDQLTDRLLATPGVRGVMLTSATPPYNRWTENFTIEGRPASPEQSLPQARFIVSDSNYLRTLRIPLLRGRDLSHADQDPASAVVLVNQEFVKQYFPNGDPLGRTVQLVGSDQLGGMGAGTRLTIVGVIGNTKNRGLAFSADPEIVGLYRQMPVFNFGFKDLVVRTAGDPYTMADTIARQLHALDPDLPLAEVSTVEEHMSAQTRDARFTTVLLGLFALVGFALAIVGVYGVISYLVAQRTQEIGIRMALGAQRANVLWLVLRQGLWLGVAGTAVGLYGAWQMGKAMQHLLWGVSPLDPATFLSASVGLMLVAGLATAIPGLSAMRIDPLLALRRQ